MKQKRKTGRKLLAFLLTLAMFVGLMPGMSLTAYAAGGGTEVTQANVICQQYSYMDAGSYSGSGYDTPPVDITNITLAEAQAFGAAVNCPTTYWVVVYAKDGDNLKWTSNGKTGEQTSTPFRTRSAWSMLYNSDVFSIGDPYSNVTFYFSKGLASVAVTGVELNKTETTLSVGDTETLAATVKPENATDKSVTWSSSNTAVATVSDGGLVTAVAAGTANITATATNGTNDADDDKFLTCLVTVNKKAGTISYAQANVSKSNGDAAFTNALTNTGDGAVSYASDNTDVAIVDATTGEVTIQSYGEANITATVADGDNYAYATKKASYKLTVAKRSYEVKFDANGHGTAPASQNVEEDGKATKPADLTTDGYVFSGWYKEASCEHAWDFDTDIVMGATTIYAKWIADGEKDVTTDVRKDEKSPDLKVANLTDKFAESTLTAEEQTLIEDALNNGDAVEVEVYLSINDISDDIVAADKAKVEALAADADQLEYFDISLYKEITIGGVSQRANPLQTLATPLKLTISVPKSFPAVASGYTRTYVVIRLHDGKAELLPATVNADGTISFETDKFSTYALAYTDTKEDTSETATTTAATTATTTVAASTSDATTASAKAAAEDKTAPKTGDSMPIAVLVVLMLAAAGALAYMDLKKKKN